MKDERGQEAAWEEVRAEIGCYMEILFVLNSPRDKEIWQYVVGVAAQLEYLAVAVLWVEAGKPTAFEEFEDKLPLGAATDKVQNKGLLDATTIETLRAVNRLRNSVAHRSAVYGVTMRDGHRGLYKGGHVFMDLSALKRLVEETAAAVTAIGRWLDDHDEAGSKPW